MRKVIMVVPVLMTNCQVSEYSKTGPVINQIRIVIMAITNAVELPACRVVHRAMPSHAREKI